MIAKRAWWKIEEDNERGRQTAVSGSDGSGLGILSVVLLLFLVRPRPSDSLARAGTQYPEIVARRSVVVNGAQDERRWGLEGATARGLEESLRVSG